MGKKQVYVENSHDKNQNFGHVPDKRYSTNPSTTQNRVGSVRKPSEHSPMGPLHNYMSEFKSSHNQGYKKHGS